MTYAVAKKAALLMPSGPLEDGQHLYVIMTNPCDQGKSLLVSISSIKDGRFHDPACIIEVGEHPFVTKRSFVEYRLSRIIRCDHIAKCVAGWVFTPKAGVSDELFAKIEAGIEASDFTPKLVTTYHQANRHR
ncbi:hypothetical protein SLT36_20295 [Aminobacter sp. BA135]|uniref:hypothetical protein n=1 Tax=Aminobacter sp. BA135 TaxID=537596 RepID=UPI003D7A1985